MYMWDEGHVVGDVASNKKPCSLQLQLKEKMWVILM